MTSHPSSSVRNLWWLGVTLLGAFKSAPYHYQPFIVWVFAFDPGGAHVQPAQFPASKAVNSQYNYDVVIVRASSSAVVEESTGFRVAWATGCYWPPPSRAKSATCAGDFSEGGRGRQPGRRGSPSENAQLSGRRQPSPERPVPRAVTAPALGRGSVGSSGWRSALPPPAPREPPFT
jgi:hypothetical protein